MAEGPGSRPSPRLTLLLIAGLGLVVVAATVATLLWREPSGPPPRVPPAYVIAAPPTPTIGRGATANPHGSRPPGDGGDRELCRACHADSGTGTLAESTVQGVCDTCHPQDPVDPGRGHAHPLAVRVPLESTRAASPAPPLAKGRMLTCTSCHDPHGAKAPYLRGGTGTSACVSCHPGH